MSKIMWKAFGLFVLLHVAALSGIAVTVAGIHLAGDMADVLAEAWLLTLFACFALSIWVVRRSSAGTMGIAFFTISEGFLLGGLSTYCEIHFPGIVLQPVFASLSTIAAALVLFSFPRMRTIGGFYKLLFVVLFGVLVFVAHNLALAEMVFLPDSVAWGMGSPAVIGVPLSLVLSAAVVVLTSFSLLVDLEVIERSAGLDVSQTDAWRAALSIMVTVVWYLGKSIRAVFIRETTKGRAPRKT